MADRMSQYNDGFTRGLTLALKLASEGGAEAIAKELKYRGRIGNRLPVSNNDIVKAAEGMKTNIFQTVTALMLLTIHDEFGFGKKRLEQLMDRFLFKAECMEDPETLFCWQDVKEIMRDECGMDLEIRLAEGNVGIGR